MNFKYKATYRMKVKEWKRKYHENSNNKKNGMAILISDKIYFKIRSIIWEKMDIHTKSQFIRKKKIVSTK